MIEAIILGIMQGIFEWLPISSKGNLALVMVSFFGMDATSAMDMAIFLHAGTLLSAIIYFRKDLVSMVKKIRTYKPGFGSESDGLITFLFVSTVITGALGGVLFISLRSMELAGEVLIGLVGIALIATAFIQRAAKEHGAKTLNLKDSIMIGVLQGFSAIPGISRSGITVSGLLLRGYKSEQCLRLSFLMSIPAVLAAEIGLGLLDAMPVLNVEAVAGVIASFVVGLIGIHFLMGIAKRVKFWKFCMGLGILAVAASALAIIA